MFHYSAFSFTIDSAVELPELSPGDNHADITISIAKIGPPPDEEGPIFCVFANETEIRLSWGKVGTILARKGHELFVDPLPGSEPEAMRLFILGAGFAVLLYQRGLTVIHASAVEIKGQAVAFLGDKGMGKSTTAAALCSRGSKLITDDILAIQYDQAGNPFALPAYPSMKLWPEAIEALGEDPSALPRIRPEIEKRVQVLKDAGAVTPYPLAHIFLLGGSDETKIFTPPPQFIFHELMTNLYASYYEKISSQSYAASQFFRQIIQLTQKVPISMLTRKNDLSSLPEVARLIEAYVA